MRNSVLSLFLILIFSIGLSASIIPNRGQGVPEKDPPRFAGYVENQIVVKFDRNTVNKIVQSSAAQTGLSDIPSLDALAARFQVSQLIQKYPNKTPRYYKGREIDPRGWFRVNFTAKVDPEQVAREYRALPGVIDAQPIGVHRLDARIPNDPSFSTQWHLDNSNDHDMDAPEAWDIETGNSDIIVAILDTGVRYYHKDLGGANASPSNPEAARGNMWINWAEKNGSAGVDDDGNGYIDDWIGWDFVDGKSGVSGEDATTPDNDPRDFNGHGTHTSGIVGAINNNNYGVGAVAGGWNNGSQTETGNGVKVMALRIGWSGYYFIWETGYVDMGFAADAFYYAADNGARIASCSWGSSNSGGLGDAIDYFLAGGGLIFKSAGNNSDEATDYMTDRTDIIAVASTDQNDVKSDFSSYGTWVDISAPGTDIYSTYHDHNNADADDYASLSGTSMASPNAAGVAALIWSRHPDWTADQVKQRLFDTADNIDGISGNSSYAGKLGAGRVNAYNAVNDGGAVAPTAEFTSDVTEGCPPLTVNFTDQSTGDIDSWSWDFGDGNTSTAQNPSHQYASSGTYTVALTVTGPGGSDTNTKTDYITVYVAITADFSATPLSGDAPLTVNFTDQSTGDVTAWSWDFGDGNTSTVQNPSHEYTTAGTYTVTLTASNSCDSDTQTKTDYITVTEPTGNPPVADFVGDPTSGTAPLTVNFTDQSTNNPTSWSWDFGDGGTSTQQNPSHEYTAAGTYTVSLTATNADGSDTNTKTDYITVTEPAANTMHVDNITVTTESWFFFKRGKAETKIVDDAGSPVADASVSGTWSGAATNDASGTTGSDGIAVTYSSWSWGGSTFEFCVNDVTKSGWTYDANANVMTCASSDGSTSNVEVTNINIEDIEGDLGFKLAANAPNPFNPSTTITYFVPKNVQVKIDIFNILGQKVNTLVNETKSAGVHTIRWNADDYNGSKVSSGFYFYQITMDNNYTIRRKILLLK
ncbi:MAG TPA: PKD domain-containing protein [Caldithrix abyssi]|uniref:PKD domain-containing protein n=1 Tax=Caldithrix abyssi TaxID=187145 RepID=A0A7V4U0K2_CALAY|nr:PKD domain-containing protein [Caldithrix abyssi]